MTTLQYFNGKEWIFAGEYPNSRIALIALGDDNQDYRIVDGDGKVIWQGKQMNRPW